MLADVNVKRVIVTTVIVVLTVATMYAVFIVAFSYLNGRYLKKTLGEFPGLVGAEVLRAKDPPEPKVRRPVVKPATEPSGSSDEGTESSAPSNSPPKVYPSTEAKDNETRGHEMNPSRTQPSSQ